MKYSRSSKMLILSLLAVTCMTTASAQKPEIINGMEDWPSYLHIPQMPDGTKYLPVPPDTASMAFVYDYSRYEWGKLQRNTTRGVQAAHDAILVPDSVLADFKDAFGLLITKETTPHLYTLLSNVEEDAGDATQTMKVKYKRIRPYHRFKEPSLVPKDEKDLSTDGSYPSGHTSIGWALALVMAEINPACQDAILKRGYAFGESRVIAGFHYQSDVNAGYLVGSAIVARLHADPHFIKDLAAAKKEFDKVSRHLKRTK